MAMGMQGEGSPALEEERWWCETTNMINDMSNFE
jgi:hypothetical protein